MKPRRKAREAALQVLFQKAFADTDNPKELFDSFSSHFKLAPEIKERSFTLVLGVSNHETPINGLIEKYSDNWRIDRMAATDRIILQLAIFELCHDDSDDTPPKIVISDFIDIAKKYSSADAKNFINGVLDEVYNKELGDLT